MRRLVGLVVAVVALSAAAVAVRGEDPAADDAPSAAPAPLAAAAASCSPPAEPPPVSDRVGLSTHLVWLGADDQCRELQALRAAGVGWIREDLPWDQLEARRGEWDWSRADRLLVAAGRMGIRVLPILGYSTPWASTDDGGDTRHPPRDPEAYARYAAAVVERYRPGASFWEQHPDGSHAAVTAVELWNEPWGYWAWKPEPDPRAYGRLAALAAERIDAAAPGTTVLLPSEREQRRSDDRPRAWTTEVLKAEPRLAELVDGAAVHPYPRVRRRGPIDAIGRLADAMRATEAAGLDVPIWVTEIGWSTAPDHDEGVSERDQAIRLRAFLDAVLADDRIERVFVYTWNRDGSDGGDLEEHFGVRRRDGTPKPAWGVVVRALRRTAG